MKCPKNKDCPKQPANSSPTTKPLCKKCDKTGKDKIIKRKTIKHLDEEGWSVNRWL